MEDYGYPHAIFPTGSNLVDSLFMTPSCGADEAGRLQVDNIDDCFPFMFAVEANVLSINVEDSVCQVQRCHSWDLDFETSEVPSFNYIILPDGYDPCEDVYCGSDTDGECIIAGDLPSPLTFTFPNLTYNVACFCYDTSEIRNVSEGCVFGKKNMIICNQT